MNSFHARRALPAVAVLLLGLLAAAPAHAGGSDVLADQPNAPWGLDRIDQRTGTNGEYHYETTAANVRVYVVGTGVSPVPDLLNRLLPGYATGGGSTADDNGNGTFLAGVAAGTTHGVAKRAKVVPVKVLGANGSGTVAQVVAGLDWVRANAVKPAVALLSIGGGASTPVDDAVRRLIASGVTVSAAAGGSNANASDFSPARVSEALVSTALTRQDCKHRSANYGPTVDVLAPGEGITGPWPGGGVSTMSGSSVAAAFTAGAAALRHSVNPTWTPAQVHAAVVASGSPLPAGCSIPTGSPSRILHTGPFAQ